MDVQGLAQYRTGRQGSDPGPGTVIHRGSPSLGRPSLVCQEVQDLCQEPPPTWAQSVPPSLEPALAAETLATSVVLSLGKSHRLGALGGRAELCSSPGLLGRGC